MNEFEPRLGGGNETGLIAPSAIAFLEQSKRTKLPDSLPGLTLSTHRLYGDSAVSVYRANNLLSVAGVE